MTAARDEPIARTEVSIRAFGVELDGELVLPPNAAAVVTDWVVMHDTLRWLPLAYSAIGIEAAAALVTANERARDRRA